MEFAIKLQDLKPLLLLLFNSHSDDIYAAIVMI